MLEKITIKYARRGGSQIFEYTVEGLFDNIEKIIEEGKTLAERQDPHLRLYASGVTRKPLISTITAKHKPKKKLNCPDCGSEKCKSRCKCIHAHTICICGYAYSLKTLQLDNSMGK